MQINFCTHYMKTLNTLVKDIKYLGKKKLETLVFALHKKCPYSELFLSAFFPHFSRIRTEYFLRSVVSILNINNWWCFHTFTGTPPSDDRVEGPYPIVETKGNGKKSLVVQDFTYGKYLGKLRVVFDNNGELSSWNGNPILINETYLKDENVSQLVNSLRGPIIKERKVKRKVNTRYIFRQHLRRPVGVCNSYGDWVQFWVKIINIF